MSRLAKLKRLLGGHRQQHIHFVAATCLEFSPAAPAEVAGLVLFQNQLWHWRLLRVGDAVVLIERRDGVDEQRGALSASAPTLSLSAEKSESRFEAVKAQSVVWSAGSAWHLAAVAARGGGWARVLLPRGG